ncbi:class I SAM-dependent methyltransferase [Litorivicinus sp.]|nr:class I SAM-dependent methyltransferase [Litorivicinus sp.]
MDQWAEIKGLIRNENIELGPYFGHQVRNSPRHLLFTYARYKFAQKMIPQDNPLEILELGCSEGLGSLMLAEPGHKVTGIDADDEAVGHAKKTIENDRITFKSCNFLGGEFGSFDAVVSMDVIEHIDLADEQAYMDTVTKNLKPRGIAVIGTPNDTATQYASKASQIGHVNMFEASRFRELLDKNFHNTFLFSMNDEIVHTGFYPMAHYLIGLCCAPRAAVQ